jgi:phosphoglycerate dehydrogenase-like enzyme
MPKLVLDLNDRRPAWALPDWVPSKVEAALPSGWVFRVMETVADGSGDGVAGLSPELLEAVRDAEIYLGYGVSPALLEEGGGLKWIHSGAAGVGSSLFPSMVESPVLFTNSKGIHGPPMGDTALAMILHFARGLDFAVTSKRTGSWDTGPFYRADHPLTEMAAATVGVFGFGGVGREVAKRARALGARVLAFDRGPEAFGRGRDVFVDGEWCPQKLDAGPDGEGFQTLHGESGFHALLSESDFLVLTAPETPETRGILDEAALARMKPHAVLINLSRGSLVEEVALVRALEEGRLRAAGLDVFASEPLPPDHPLWQLPNVVITPHVSAVTRGFWRRQTDLILENLRRYFAGETLLNLVDKEAGY